MLLKVQKDKIEEVGFNVPTKTLTRGKVYAVYAIERKAGKEYFYILNDTHSNYPLPYLSSQFSIIDDTIPQGWLMKKDGFIFKKSLLSFPEWIDSPNYYERLIDSNPNDPERLIFQKYYNLLEPTRKTIG